MENQETDKNSIELTDGCINNHETIIINRNEKGHRLGNFHNYYNFNPSSNRIDILQRLNLIKYLQKQLGLLQVQEKETEVQVEKSIEEEEDQEENERQQKRIKLFDLTLLSTESSSSIDDKVVTYCDLGCNEGDLTMSIARRLSQFTDTCSDDEDKGNSNDSSNIQVKCLGLDIDSNLIQRANRKYCKSTMNENHHHHDSHISNVHATFQTCNIANNDTLKSKCTSFLQFIDNINNNNNSQRFDIISIFSTTMWIHIHHGDDGLKSLLQSICEMCNYIIIEPQPSKCYRSVNIRLRKMNVEEIDVSFERLKMRKDIENEIDKVIVNCGFERIHDCGGGDHSLTDHSKNNDQTKDRTSWNRTLRLYRRIQI